MAYVKVALLTGVLLAVSGPLHAQYYRDTPWSQVVTPHWQPDWEHQREHEMRREERARERERERERHRGWCYYHPHECR
jgi:hypothetical protein